MTLLTQLSGGRTWWAHFEFTRINITPTILPKKIEDLRTLGAFRIFLPRFSRRKSQIWYAPTAPNRWTNPSTNSPDEFEWGLLKTCAH
jgi:hypothetical protein